VSRSPGPHSPEPGIRRAGSSTIQRDTHVDVGGTTGISSNPTVMTDPTRASLILRVKDARDKEAWSSFVDIYQPLIEGYGRKRGLQAEDAADLTQEVMQTVASAIQRFEYERAKGPFRSWLLRITYHKLGHFFQRRKRHSQGSGETAMPKLLEQQPDVRAIREFDRDYKRRLFEWACEAVEKEFQSSTWDAFRRTMIDEEQPRHVAEALGMSTSAVYQAKSRVLARVREKVLEIVDDE